MTDTVNGMSGRNGAPATQTAQTAQTAQAAQATDHSVALDTERIITTLRQIASAAQANPALAARVRDAIFESGLLDVFGVGERLDVVDLLDTGGEDALRARLDKLPLADLRALVRANGYDPARESARWRSVARFTDLIVEKAKAQLEQEQKTGAATPALAEASWML